MPVAEDIKSSWADEVDLEDAPLPAPTEYLENGLKIVTEYKYNNDDKKVKIVRTYKIEKRIVSKSIASRKTWAKFGDSSGDKPGPNPATTLVSEDVYMQFITSKEESTRPDDVEADPLKASPAQIFKCRTCQGDHWTVSCPFKHTSMANLKTDPAKPGQGMSFADANKLGVGGTGTTTSSNKYVAPFLREGAQRPGGPGAAGSSMPRRDDTAAIRVSNLSESTVEADLEDLVKKFGPVQKLYLAKDRTTGLCKGFAYIHFKFRADAAVAVKVLNGHGFDHLILSADWSKPPAQQNN